MFFFLKMEDLFNDIDTINKEETPNMMHLNQLPIGVRFAVEKIDSAEFLHGRGVRLYFHKDEAPYFVFVPRRYVPKFTEPRIQEINISIAGGKPPYFAFLGMEGQAFRFGLFESLNSA